LGEKTGAESADAGFDLIRRYSNDTGWERVSYAAGVFRLKPESDKGKEKEKECRNALDTPYSTVGASIISSSTPQKEVMNSRTDPMRKPLQAIHGKIKEDRGL
jgi:hypothetical protein